MSATSEVVGSEPGTQPESLAVASPMPISDRLRGAAAVAAPPSRPVTIFTFLAVHAILGVVMEASPLLGLVHMLAVLGIGLTVAFGSDLARLVQVGAYASACDVLWRQTEVPGPWEGGKYLLILLLGIGIVRFLGRPGRMPYLLALGAFLIPATVITIGQQGLADARDPISFNLVGHGALMVAVGLMSRVVTDEDGLEALIWSLLAPITAIAAVASNGTLGVSRELFESGASLSATSGGFGPNQVSAVIGAGALFGVWMALLVTDRLKQVIALGLVLWFFGQSALTFSRGGLAGAAMALAAGGVFLLADRRRRRTMAIGGAGLTLALIWFVIPRLQSLTGGALGNRFSSPDSTGRVDLSERDLETFAQHPWFGAGVGLSKSNRRLPDGSTAAAHTEYTRLVADHGVIGIGILVVLVLLAASAVLSNTRGFGRAWSAAATIWAFAAMGHSAMRVALIGFVFGIAFIRIEQLDRLDHRSSGGSNGSKTTVGGKK